MLPRPADARGALNRRLIVTLLIITMIGGGVAFAWQQLALQQIDKLRQAGAHHLDAWVISLEHLLARHESLPFVLSQERRLLSLVEHPEDGRLNAEVNGYLETIQARAGIAAAYLLDADGRTLAASNWNTAQSFIGQNYRFRPYFQESIGGRPGRFYGIGATTQEAGYFLSAPILRGSRAVAVVVVKISLDPVESAWRTGGEKVALADADGVIFLSAVGDWKYRSLAPLSDTVRQRLFDARQYAGMTVPALIPGQPISGEGEVRRIGSAAASPGGTAFDHLIQARTLGPLGWRLLYFSPVAEARGAAAASAAAIGFAGAFLVALLFYRQQRQRRLAERRRAAGELQQLSDALEERIAQRTGELTAANADLAARVAALHSAEQILRSTRDNAVQAGKLAVLGQMAAGITHELNQPLAALNTLSDNAVTLLSRGESDELRDNLLLIAELTARMGRIVGELKAFARKAPTELEAVDVPSALERALFLVEGNRRDAGVTVAIELDAALPRVCGDRIRLEQVLVNLLRNGIDAMRGTDGIRRLNISCRSAGSRVSIEVCDNGPGIAAETLPQLFSPFFTTKPAGEGLGLGLAISRAIVDSFGGDISAHNLPTGGACFSLRLPSTGS